MPGQSLNKVQKHIAKKKGKGAVLHDKSRDTHRLQRASARDDKLNRLMSVREKQNRPFLERIAFFKTAASEHSSPLTPSEVQELIEKYVHRDDEEFATLKAERRPGRPPSNREVLLKQRFDADEKEYISGFWIPDMEDEKNVNTLKDWNEQWVSLSTMKFVRIAKEGTRHESTFPPKGQS